METDTLNPQSPLHREQGRHALIAGYIAIWLLMTLLSVASLGYMAAIQEQLRDIVAIHNTKKDLVKQMHAASRERVFGMQHMLLLDDPFELDSETLRIYENGAQFTKAREQFMQLPLDATEQQIMASHTTLASRAGPVQRDAMTLIMQDDKESARRFLIKEVIPIQQQALTLLRDLEEYQDASIKKALLNSENSYKNARSLLVILGGFAVMLLLSIAVKVFRVMHQAAQALHDEKDKLRVTLNSIGDGVIATDSNGTIDYINPVAEDLTGWDKNEARGAAIFDIFRIINASDEKPVAASIEELIDEAFVTDPHHHSLLRRRDGATVAVDYTTSAIRHTDGSIGGYVTVFRDESELREMAQHLSHQARHDPLTNLANRREFERQLESLLKQNRLQHAEHVLCYLDLDRFKIVNDSCGHAAGDELLKQIVTLLRQRVRSNDLLARIGGDEFGLLLENCPVERALGITEEIRNSVHRYRFLWKGQSFQIGVSIGMVVIDQRWTGLAELLAAADAACYAAKDGGRNRVHLYLSGEAGDANNHETSWAVRIRHALDHEHLIHYFQKPVALRPSMASDYCIDLQLRIMEQGRQRLPFAPLVSQAERLGLAAAVDRRSVEHALMLAMLRENKEIFYSVPLSSAALKDECFADDVMHLAQARGIAPELLCLEIPESYLQANIRQASAAALALKEKGFRIALDGIGQSLGTLDAVRTLPFEFVRISGDFIHEAMEDPLLHIQFEAIVRMAHSVGWRVIAMDVQSRRMIEQLSELGIDYLSGHGIDKPQPAVALLINDAPENWYETRSA